MKQMRAVTGISASRAQELMELDAVGIWILRKMGDPEYGSEREN